MVPDKHGAALESTHWPVGFYYRGCIGSRFKGLGCRAGSRFKV